MAIEYPQGYDDEFLNIIKKIIDELNAKGYTYDQAIKLAENILEEAKQTNDMNVDVKNQIYTIMNDLQEQSVSVPEVVSARFDLHGNEYTVLKERLDSDQTKLEKITSTITSENENWEVV